MKSFVFCTSFIDEKLPNLTIGRYSKWVLYYQSLLEEIGAEHLFLIDDGSTMEDLSRIKGATSVLSAGQLPETLKGKATIVSFPDHLGITSLLGWWRNFFFSHTL